MLTVFLSFVYCIWTYTALQDVYLFGTGNSYNNDNKFHLRCGNMLLNNNMPPNGTSHVTVFSFTSIPSAKKYMSINIYEICLIQKLHLSNEEVTPASFPSPNVILFSHLV